HGVGTGFMTGRISAHAVGAVGHDRIGAGGRDQCHIWHIVDGKFAAVATLDKALRQDTCCRAVSNSHPVADEKDDVLGRGAWRIENLPDNAGLGFTGRGFHHISAGRGQDGITNPERRIVATILMLDHGRGSADDRVSVRPVNAYPYGRRGWGARKFDLKVEPGARQNFSPVQRIDRLSLRGRGRRQKQRCTEAGYSSSFHWLSPRRSVEIQYHMQVLCKFYCDNMNRSCRKMPP